MKVIEPSTLVIFGAAGNLSRIKLIPSLFRLEIAKRLPEHSAIVGCSIEQRQHDEWIAEIVKMLNAVYPEGIDQPALARFCARMHYHAITPGDETAYQRLQQKLEERGTFPPNMVFYMSVSPAAFPDIVDKLGNVGLLQQKHGWRRVVIEKPFGYD